MKVKELMDCLVKCNPESYVYVGEDFTDEYDAAVVMEVTVSSTFDVGVHILGEC